jgi:hypothetical protein
MVNQHGSMLANRHGTKSARPPFRCFQEKGLCASTLLGRPSRTIASSRSSQVGEYFRNQARSTKIVDFGLAKVASPGDRIGTENTKSANIENQHLWKPATPHINLIHAIARSWVQLARMCHSQELAKALLFRLSSSRGGLPGRPMTRESSDARFLFSVDLDQYVEMVKFTVMRASVSTGCPLW